MRISELSVATGVPVATIKYYLREGLLPEGRRRSATQADYDDGHATRLRIVRALIEAGVSIAETRAVVAALTDPPTDPHDLLGAAHGAVTPPVPAEVDTRDAAALVARMGWDAGVCDPAVLGSVAVALRRIEHAGFEIPDDVLSAYLDAAMLMARAEIAGVPTSSTDAAVQYVVLGTVLNEPLILALRRVAEAVASAERFGQPAPSKPVGRSVPT